MGRPLTGIEKIQNARKLPHSWKITDNSGEEHDIVLWGRTNTRRTNVLELYALDCIENGKKYDNVLECLESASLLMTLPINLFLKVDDWVNEDIRNGCVFVNVSDSKFDWCKFLEENKLGALQWGRLTAPNGDEYQSYKLNWAFASTIKSRSQSYNKLVYPALIEEHRITALAMDAQHEQERMKRFEERVTKAYQKFYDYYSLAMEAYNEQNFTEFQHYNFLATKACLNFYRSGL